MAVFLAKCTKEVDIRQQQPQAQCSIQHMHILRKSVAFRHIFLRRPLWSFLRI
jgi:hypothetical protein